jgi:hypothetical protein
LEVLGQVLLGQVVSLDGQVVNDWIGEAALNLSQDVLGLHEVDIVQPVRGHWRVNQLPANNEVNVKFEQLLVEDGVDPDLGNTDEGCIHVEDEGILLITFPSAVLPLLKGSLAFKFSLESLHSSSDIFTLVVI